VINLKGQGAGSTAYTQAADAGQLDVRYVRLSARRWPSPAEIEKLVSHLESAERPVLIHCQGGTDRSGLAAAIALLLAGESPELASEQFSLKFGYPGPVLGSDLPGFLASYRAWLSDRNCPTPQCASETG
jgi:protein tyrosine/serine phosphatase